MDRSLCVHMVNPQRWNMFAKAAGKLNIVIYDIHLLKNKFTTSIKRGTLRKSHEFCDPMDSQTHDNISEENGPFSVVCDLTGKKTCYPMAF